MAMVTFPFRGGRRTEWKRRPTAFLGREEEKKERATCQVLSTSRVTLQEFITRDGLLSNLFLPELMGLPHLPTMSSGHNLILP